MKRILALLLALCLLFCLVACGNEDTTSDITSDVSQTQSTTDTSSKNESTASSTESGTETSTSTPTNSETPSTTSKPTDTSKPTTSTTTQPTETHIHTWGYWSNVEQAFVGKDGKSERTCSGCGATETKTTTSNMLYTEISCACFFENSQVNYNEETITASTLLNHLAFMHTYESLGITTLSLSLSYSSTIEYLSKNFYLSDTLKEDLKKDSRYNSTTDEFTFTPYYPSSGYDELGYIHNGGNSYSLYNKKNNTYWKVDIEYNFASGKPNKYISVVRVQSVPNNLTTVKFY